MNQDMDADRLRGIVEAVLMTADAPVTPGKLQALVKGVTGKDLRQAVETLDRRYREGGHAMTIAEVAGGFQIVTVKEYGPWVRKFHDRGQVRLSPAALETLAIVAFKQPVTRVEIDSVRGVDSGGVLRTLMEVNMVRIVGRSEGVGRPMLFGTTRDFMTHFGLRSLADLPRPRELEELLAEGERKARTAAGAGDDGAEAEGAHAEEPPPQGALVPAPGADGHDGSGDDLPDHGDGEDSQDPLDDGDGEGAQDRAT